MVGRPGAPRPVRRLEAPGDFTKTTTTKGTQEGYAVRSVHPLQGNQRDSAGYTRRLLRLLKRQKTCMICSKAFQEGETAFYGFDSKAEELCTCDYCQNHITEFVTRSAVRVRKAYKEPSAADTLWRYLDLAKFISLLEESALYFCRGDNFLNDPFEGEQDSNPCSPCGSRRSAKE
jgi:DNA-directed RNA polymerase subunit RPC12/RpoP